MSFYTRLLYFVAALVFTIIGIGEVKKSKLEAKIKESGNVVKAVIVERPRCSNKACTLKIELRGKSYRLLNIGRNARMKEKYRVGKTIDVLYDKEHDIVMTPDRAVEASYHLSLLMFIIPLFCLYQMLRPRSED